MKTPTLLGLLYICQALKWDQAEVSVSARGTYNAKEQYWTGALTECDRQCKDSKGSVCGKSERQCCQASACKTKFSLEVCEKLVEGFTCHPDTVSSLRLADTLSKQKFPELASLYTN